jgi:putative FmdB family regulatory protein
VPLYEYKCRKCGKRSERIEKLNGPYLKKCPFCGGSVERLMSAPAIQFKGSGWYVNDYAKSSSTGGAAAADKAAADKEQGKSAEKDGEKKPAGKEKEKEKGREKEKKAPAKEAKEK